MTPLEFVYAVRKQTAKIMMAGHQGRAEYCGELAAELSTLAGQMEKTLTTGGGSTLQAPDRYDLGALEIEEDPEPGE